MIVTTQFYIEKLMQNLKPILTKSVCTQQTDSENGNNFIEKCAEKTEERGLYHHIVFFIRNLQCMAVFGPIPSYRFH